MDYVAWGTTSLGGFAAVELLQNFSNRAELRSGRSFASEFPDNAVFAMNPKARKETKLADAIATREGDGVMLVSSALADFLGDLDAPELEFLPVAIHDHSGEPAEASYFIANSFHVLDVLIEDEMGLLRNPLDGSIMACEKLVLDMSKLGSAPPIFRPLGFEGRMSVGMSQTR